MRGSIGALVAAIAAVVAAVGAATWARRQQAEDELDLEVAETTVIEAAPPAAVDASADEAAVPAAVDDLTAIKGLGKVKVAKLAAMGITSYAQIADWTDEDIAEVGLKVNTSPGQIKREDWVGQARVLTGD